jgi:hypothetical protein
LFTLTAWTGRNRRALRQNPDAKRKAPPFGGTLLLSLGLETGLALALARLAGLLALTARILLLLSGLLATALLLAGLLTWFLVLLARVLVLAGHRDLPC